MSAVKDIKKTKEKKEVAGFLLKLYEICSNNDLKSVIDYGPTGETIIVKNVDRFIEDVLPCYFRHKNYQSFVRQLNMYDFHKTMANPKDGEFKHKYFIKGRMDLLPLIKRKEKKTARPNESDDDDDDDDEINHIPITTSPGDSKTSISSLPPIVSHENVSVIMEKNSIVTELRNQRTISEKVLQQIAQIENENSILAMNNSILSKSISENQKKQEQIHKRLDNVLKALYMMQYSDATPTPIEQGRPVKLIQSIVNNGAIPSRLNEQQTKWIEDFANSLIKNAPIMETSSPSSPRLFEDDDVYRAHSFEELIRENIPRNIPLGRTHSLYTEDLDENYSNNYEIYNGYDMSNVANGAFPDINPSRTGKGPGRPRIKPLPDPSQIKIQNLTGEPRKVGRPRKHPLPGSQDLDSSSVGTVNSRDSTKRTRDESSEFDLTKKHSMNSVNSMTSLDGSISSSKRSKSAELSDNDEFDDDCDNENNDKINNNDNDYAGNENVKGEIIAIEGDHVASVENQGLIEVLNKESTITLNETDSLESAPAASLARSGGELTRQSSVVNI